MRVLWFTTTPVGGEEVLKQCGIRGGWLPSLEKFLKQKVELSVSFYYARTVKPFEHKGVSYFPICKKHWKLNIVKKELFGGFIDREDIKVYLEIIAKVKPDIIHIHGTEEPFGCLVNETEVPVVISIQGNYTVYNHKYFSGIERRYASLRDINIWSPYSWVLNKSWNRRYRISSIPKTAREKRNLHNCRFIIGRTDWDRRITSILAPKSVYFHCDEVLRESFYQNSWIKPDTKTLVVHTTCGEAIFKGFETVCMALSELIKIGFNIEWRVAGVSKGSLLDKMVKKKLKSAYPDKGLILFGNLPENKLLERMLEAHIYVLPSHIENSPNSLCEAMILGMPCITTLAGGSSSLLKDKEEGLVIQDGDPWSMAGAILELARDSDLANRYGQKARERALLRHNPDKIVRELMNTYNFVVNMP